jgi:N-acetyl-alpha-D-muramate 1-phosphate uridylyltransferase
MIEASGTSRMPTLALLAGGLATRMHPLTEAVPKSLLPVAGEPFLAHQLRWLAHQGVRDILICCGHLSAQIRDFAGDGSRFGISVRYSEDGDRPLGTGGAVRHALPQLGERFMVLYGDSLLTAPLQPIWRRFCSLDSPGLMTVYGNAHRWDTSNVEIAGGRVVRYVKRGNTNGMTHIDYGLSLFHAKSFSAIPDGRVFDLGLVFQELIMQGELACYEVHRRFYEIGSFAGLEETDAKLRRVQHASVERGGRA